MKIQQLSISYSDALNSHILSLQKGRLTPWYENIIQYQNSDIFYPIFADYLTQNEESRIS